MTIIAIIMTIILILLLNHRDQIKKNLILKKKITIITIILVEIRNIIRDVPKHNHLVLI